MDKTNRERAGRANLMACIALPLRNVHAVFNNPEQHPAVSRCPSLGGKMSTILIIVKVYGLNQMLFPMSVQCFVVFNNKKPQMPIKCLLRPQPYKFSFSHKVKVTF